MKNKDKVIIKKSFIRKCLTCRKSRLKNLSGGDVPNGFIFCVHWNAPKPNNAVCEFWSV